VLARLGRGVAKPQVKHSIVVSDPYRIDWRAWAASFVPLLLFFAAAIVADRHTAFGDLDELSGIPELGLPLLFLVLRLVNGLGEEGGWRGYLFPSFRMRFALVPASMAVTAIWAAWHVPLFLVLESYQDFDAVTLLGFVIGWARLPSCSGECTNAPVEASWLWRFGTRPTTSSRRPRLRGPGLGLHGRRDRLSGRDIALGEARRHSATGSAT
jgi:Type II CAAX prenyl endopeptidase Rce1-like